MELSHESVVSTLRIVVLLLDSKVTLSTLSDMTREMHGSASKNALFRRIRTQAMEGRVMVTAPRVTQLSALEAVRDRIRLIKATACVGLTDTQGPDSDSYEYAEEEADVHSSCPPPSSEAKVVPKGDVGLLLNFIDSVPRRPQDHA